MPSYSRKTINNWPRMIFLLALVLLAGCTRPQSASPTAEPTSTATTNVAPTEPWANTPAPGRVYRDQIYCSVDGVGLTFDLSYPEALDDALPLVVYVHGGAWLEGDKAGGAGIVFKRALLDAGYAFASVNYRLAPEDPFPAQIEDVKCAIRFFRANAGALGVDPDRFVAMGGSAGGHLVSLLGLTAGAGLWEDTGGYPGVSSSVAAVVDLFGPMDLRPMTHPDYQVTYEVIFGEAVQSEAAMWDYSPLAYVTEDAPPFLILHGDADRVVFLHHSQNLAAALAAAGVPAELIVVSGGGHSTDLFNPDASPDVDSLTESLLAFLETTVGAE